MRFVRSIPLALGLLCQANMICNGQPANVTSESLRVLSGHGAMPVTRTVPPAGASLADSDRPGRPAVPVILVY